MVNKFIVYDDSTTISAAKPHLSQGKQRLFILTFSDFDDMRFKIGSKERKQNFLNDYFLIFSSYLFILCFVKYAQGECRRGS